LRKSSGPQRQCSADYDTGNGGCESRGELHCGLAAFTGNGLNWTFQSAGGYGLAFGGVLEQAEQRTMSANRDRMVFMVFGFG
jgi:hypothetical protein